MEIGNFNKKDLSGSKLEDNTEPSSKRTKKEVAVAAAEVIIENNKMTPEVEKLLAAAVPHLNPPQPTTRVYKDECMFCFDSPVSILEIS